MEKTTETTKKILRSQYAEACNAYLAELLRMWELDAHYGYWIGDEVGGLYDYADGTIDINMDDIIYCVDHGVEKKDFMAWADYVCDASEFGIPTPNLRSWMHGCPRTPQEVFTRLRQLKADIDQAIEDEKQRATQNGGF